MSTYSTNLKIELIGTGEQAGTWGQTTDDNFSNVFEQAIVGRVTVPFTDADVTLSASNNVNSQSFRNVYLNCTGTNTASRNLVVPTINKNYVVENNTTGGFNIVVKTAAGTGVTIPNGYKCAVYVDGTNVVQASNYFPSFIIGSLTVTSLTDTGLTSGRVTYATTGGLLTDSANLQFNGTTLTVANDASISGLTVGKGASAISSNTALGVAALPSITSGGTNTAIGYSAGYYTTTGAGNSFLGYSAGPNQATSTGSFNTGIGAFALQANTTASYNTALGYQAGYSGTTGNKNTLLGAFSGYATTAGGQDTFNTFVGYASGYTQTSGIYNTYIGPASGYQMTTGSKNTILGNYSGNQGGLDIRTASNYIVLSDGDGNPRQYFNGSIMKVGTSGANTGTDGSSILYGNRASSVAWVLQNNATTNGYVLELISGTSAGTGWNFVDGYDAIFGTPTLKFKIDGTGSMYNSTGTYGTISDIKLKENIVDATPKLDKVMQLKVKNFNFKNDPDLKQIGFIAQEFEQVFPSLVDETEDKDTDKNPTGETTKAIKTAVLIPILVKAIQELKAEVDSLKQQLGK